jgi:hypothetical protein
MKRIISILIAFAFLHSAFSQTKMIINKTGGTADSLLLSEIKSIAFSGSTVSGKIVLADSFNSNINNWTGWGSPLPRWVASGFGRSGLFDNNGDPNYSSGGYSKNTVSTTGGMVIESDVYLNITDQAGCWVGAEIGLTKTVNPTPTDVDIDYGLYFTLDFSGDACWGDSVQYQRHRWFWMGFVSEDGSYDNPTWNKAPFLNADAYSSTSWHTLKVDITPSRIVKFYCDNNLIWTSVKEIDSALLTNKNVQLGWRSSGSAGKAYHDWVKVTTY